MVNKRGLGSKSKSRDSQSIAGCIPNNIGDADVGVEIDNNTMGEDLNEPDEPSKAELKGARQSNCQAIRRSSARVSKRVKRDISPPTSPIKKQCQGKFKTNTPEGKRTGRRAWELWSKTDQNLFFDGLYEFGKNFDAIHRFIAVRQKKRGYVAEMRKNKDQIRHFYYRTWHKISKWIQFKEDIKKQTQEVYALINYGEFRKRISGALDTKLGYKLNELFHTGTMTVKIKGKTIRVRTPVCRALKKLNKIEDPKEEEMAKLPKEIVIELRPKTNADWAYVHAMAQNPRLRMHIRPGRRLSSIIKYLQRKWRPQHTQLRELLDLQNEPDRRLKLTPIGDVVPISLKVNPPSKKMDMGLNLVKDNLKEIDLTALRKFGEKVKEQAQRERQHKEEQRHQENVSSLPPVDIFDHDTRSPADVKPSAPLAGTDDNTKPPCSAPHNDVPDIQGPCSIESLDEFSNTRSSEPLDLETEPCARQASIVDERCLDHCKRLELANAYLNTLECAEIETCEVSPEELTDLEVKFRQGWTDLEGSEITIAEVYEILNQPAKVYFQYEWLDEPRALEFSNLHESKLSSSIKQERSALSSTLRDESQSDVAQSGRDDLSQSVKPSPDKFAHAMRKLLLVARTQFIDLAKKQVQVGCVCGAPRSDGSPSGGSRMNRQQHNRSPATPKQFAKKSSPGVSKTTGRRGGSAKSKKELDMRGHEISNSSISAAPSESVQDDNGQIGSSSTPEFLAPAPVAVRPIAPSVPANPAQLAHMNRITQDTFAQTRQFIQQFDSLHKRSDPLWPRNKMRLNQQKRKVPIIVQRPLLPKSAFTPRQMVAMTMMSGAQGGQATGFVPMTIPHNVITPRPMGHIHATALGSIPSIPIASVASSSSQNVRLAVKPDEVDSLMEMLRDPSSSDCGVATDSVSSMDVAMGTFATPTSEADVSISNILDISLPPPDSGTADSDDLLDLALDNNVAFSRYLNDHMNATSLGQSSSILSTSTPAQSPMKIPDFLLNAESGDISLSGILDSPVKRDVSLGAPPTSLFSESSRDSITNKFECQVDTTLQCMMNESSMDYISKFADLAAQIAASADSDNGRHEPIT